MSRRSLAASFSRSALVACGALFAHASTFACSTVDPGGVELPEPPAIATGFDAFRQWERWPLIRIGARTYMRSTYDRTGGNEAADASHFLRQAEDGSFVTLDVAGSGVLSFVRTNHWHGSPWHYSVDGRETIVQESSTADPLHPVAGSTFLPSDLFPPPLALTWSTTQGADLSWVPIPFERSVSLAYERTHYGTGYYIYQLFSNGAKLTSPLVAWDAKTPPPLDVLELIDRAGQDIAPNGPGVRIDEGLIEVAAAGTTTLADLQMPSGAVRAIRLTVPLDQAEALASTRIRITWDDRPLASVDAPVPLFFGSGTLFNRTGREYLVKAFPVSIRFRDTHVTLAAYFPMPFQNSAKIEIVASSKPVSNLEWQVRTSPFDHPSNHAGYFHATYRDHGLPIPGQDLVLLDTTTTEGGGEWCGSFIGTSFVFSRTASLGTLEGDPRFFFDDNSTPQAQGTGTEEWAGGGDYWGGMTMTLPFAGHPVGAPNADLALNEEDKIESAYRYLLSDLFPFGKNARIQLEHGGYNDSSEHYQTLAYWYGLPGVCLVLSDTLHVGDANDEIKHRYASPDASAVDTLTSRYEWGVDTAFLTEVFPETTDTGRHTAGTSEFSLSITPVNYGVLLRRKLDYAYPDQRAEVYVADDRDNATFEHAGTWYLAGSNTSIYSNPLGELDPPLPIIQVSNRRWREDEFLIGRRLTEKRSSIRIRIVFAPVSLPLAPGVTLAPQAWSEFRYWAYSWVLP